MSIEKGQNHIGRTRKYISSVIGTGMLLASTLTANAQTSMKELVQKKDFNKDISTVDSLSSPDGFSFKDEENNILQFKNNFGNYLYSQLTKKQLSSADYSSQLKLEGSK